LFALVANMAAKEPHDLDRISQKVLDERKGLVGGGIIEALLKLKDLLLFLEPKICFWSLVGIAALSYSWSVPLLIILAGFLAVWASYKCSPHPQGIPLAPPDIDVLLGRSIKVSEDAAGLHANNNVSITVFKGQYILAYRKSDTHWPSGKTQLIVASSSDLQCWKKEWTYANGCDLREMLLFQMKGRLMLYYFSLKPANNIFHPLHVYSTSSGDAATWTEPQEVCRDGEVPWEIKVRSDQEGEVAFKASYLGDHYGAGDVLTLFECSKDGIHWEPAGKSDSSIVYRGGVCEVAFEFTAAGDLVAIGRNEDGDASGFGTQLFFAHKEDLGTWTKLTVSIPWRFDSPRMVRSNSTGEILLFARYAVNRFQLAPQWMNFMHQKVLNLITYNVLPKSAAVYRIAPPQQWGQDGAGAVQIIRFFERAFGDTGFFSLAPEIKRSPVPSESSSDDWVVANYISHECHSHAPWIVGQTSPTSVQVCRCRVLRQNT